MVHGLSKKESIVKREYTIPLYRVYWGRRSNRAKRAINLIRRFVQRHFKEAEKIVIDNAVNEYVWSRGIEKPPRRVRVVIEYRPEDKLAKVLLVRKP